MIPLVYVAGPYRGPSPAQIDTNIARAREAGKKVCGTGAYPVIPHANTAHFEGAAPDKFWLPATLELCSRCDAILLLDGWERSVGSRGEHALMEKAGKQVFLESDPNWGREMLAWVNLNFGCAWQTHEAKKEKGSPTPPPKRKKPNSDLYSGSVNSDFIGERGSGGKPKLTTPDFGMPTQSRKMPLRKLPETWAPSKAHRDLAEKRGLDLQQEVDAFVAHAHAKDRRMANWDAAFRMWLTKAYPARHQNTQLLALGGGQELVLGLPGGEVAAPPKDALTGL